MTQLSQDSLRILDNYSDKSNSFLNESIKIFDRLLSYHIETSGLSENDNWNELLSLCNKSIDMIMESSFETGYCKFD